MTRTLFKTKIVIWSEHNHQGNTELVDLAREATDGEAYCSVMTSERIANPDSDNDWDGTEFFELIT